MSFFRSCAVKRLPLLVWLLLSGLVGSGVAGELDKRLAERIAASTSDELIPVWISLRQESSVARTRQLAESPELTREERYRQVLQALKSTHTTSQRQIVSALAGPLSDGRVKNLRKHWLANLITAEIAPSLLAELAARADVELIQQEPVVTLIAPEEIRSAPAQSSSVESNLSYIRAPQAWGMGYTGKGRLVCSFDTGVNGEHPAIKNSWNGANGDSLASWYDPTTNQRSPHTFSGVNVNPWHGSHVMGIILGRSGADTTGVAPDASWISAAVIDIAGASIVQAFEWAADPDGDPNTVADLPDVINHSWGVQEIGCADPFFELIDNIEALGVVNIFAAGNEGSIGGTIRNPAVRALDSIDCFAVGNIEHAASPVVIAPSSSRGPSTCDGISRKPNVAAPGTLIRSLSNVTGSYLSATGTSMAAPHVSGLVALMREKNPNATVREIKTAILNSATPLGARPNNDVGWGIIDCVNALNALPAAPASANLRVYSFAPNIPVTVGAIIDGELAIQNLGGNASNARVTITSAHPLLSVNLETTLFGSVAGGDTLSRAFSRVCVSNGAVPGDIYTLELLLEADGFSAPGKLFFVIEPVPQPSQINLANGTLEYTVTNYGVHGLGSGSILPVGGRGFRLSGGSNELYESGLMIARASADLVSGVHSYLFEPEFDFLVAPGGDLVTQNPGSLATFQSSCSFQPKDSNLLGSIRISQETFLQGSGTTDVLWIRYIISNPTGDPLSGLYVGQFLDWDANAEYNRNAGGFESAEQFLWTALNTGTTTNSYRCAKLVMGTLSAAVTASASALVYTGPNGGDGFTPPEKFSALTGGTSSKDTYRTSSIDICQTIASGPHSIGAGEADTVVFALFAAASLNEARTVSARAAIFPSGPTAPPDDAPDRFELCQNFPNPFNPTTTIEFLMPARGDYAIEIFNLLGQRVDRLSGTADAGVQRVVWDAGDRASGVFFYRIEAVGWSATRKMLLVR